MSIKTVLKGMSAFIVGGIPMDVYYGIKQAWYEFLREVNMEMVNMIFKLGILKEEKIKLLSSIIAVLIMPVAILIICIIKEDDLKLAIMFLSIFILPILILLILFGLNNLEWFHIYEDKIEARCIFGIKNIVYFKDVLFVQELKINLTSRGTPKQFLILPDGRKNNDSLFDLNSCYNKRHYNLRIYKTPEIENFLTNYLSLKINNA